VDTNQVDIIRPYDRSDVNSGEPHVIVYLQVEEGRKVCYPEDILYRRITQKTSFNNRYSKFNVIRRHHCIMNSCQTGLSGFVTVQAS
jgi:hypothetical protein